MSDTPPSYYVPPHSYWPLVGCIGLTTLALGVVLSLRGGSSLMLLAGIGITLFMLFGWFRDVIRESMSGLYSDQMDRSFRWGMAWFIFSEVMFFAAFFGALFYVRIFALPWLDGASNNVMTAELLWPDFQNMWPLLTNPDNSTFSGPQQAMGAWGLPALNTAILLTSGVTLTIAHWGLIKNNRMQLILGLLATVLLGIAFVCFQILEYGHAWNELGLTISSGIYGSTFYLLTGFHGLHVSIGTIMLLIILIRCMKGHFSKEQHFGFEAVAWYWHFVDVVWLLLFVFVYWI